MQPNAGQDFYLQYRQPWPGQSYADISEGNTVPTAVWCHTLSKLQHAGTVGAVALAATNAP